MMNLLAAHQISMILVSNKYVFGLKPAVWIFSTGVLPLVLGMDVCSVLQQELNDADAVVPGGQVQRGGLKERDGC